MKKRYKTDQEEFWAGEFGTHYIERNRDGTMLPSLLSLFSRALKNAGMINSCIEFGANIGMNLKALKSLYPSMKQQAIEINEDAAKELSQWVGESNVFTESIINWEPQATVDLTLIKGVLIHINPNKLLEVYEKLYISTHRYIFLGEYYNPTPVEISYRGHKGRLFKRDFAGEMLDIYPDLKLIDYGFVYRRDSVLIEDDITWFLLRKK